jgi:hypothetical protein
MCGAARCCGVVFLCCPVAYHLCFASWFAAQFPAFAMMFLFHCRAVFLTQLNPNPYLNFYTNHYSVQTLFDHVIDDVQYSCRVSKAYQVID